VADGVLIANRGEIAGRIARTVHALGRRSIAIYTDADADSAHVDAADVAVRVTSYLDIEAVIEAAGTAGAGAVHPGYGFLSENAAFARAVGEAGLQWIGPPPAAIELMGDKAQAKRLAAQSGVPVLPGLEGDAISAAEIAAFAGEHGYPIVIKAVAGGGGKGMRVVREAEGIDAAVESAAREATAAFGDGRFLVERYLERPRHIEVQILADSHGACIHLGERECSLQRRHQKVVEEAPSPAVGPAMRAALGTAAVALARACGYAGAGTVEFIVPAGSEEFFFLEMNTRLQVEHPVTELVYGVDLVALQLQVASGEPLTIAQDDVVATGHAVEARIYAEDPAAGFLPAVGTVLRYAEPAGVRVDSGIRAGAQVGTAYDPMLAKVIAAGPDRATALARLHRALGELEIVGIATNASFSRVLLERDDVRAADMDTGLLERILDDEDFTLPPDLAAAAAIAAWRHDTAGQTLTPGPWRQRFDALGEVRVDGDSVIVGDEHHRFTVRALDDGALRLALDGVSRRYATAITGDAVFVARDGHHLEARFERPQRAGNAVAPGSLEAPMPGTVLAINVENGDDVSEGDVLVILESMKMELSISAPLDGVVSGLELAVGDSVARGQALLAVTK
jgi:3-methylcrotonyl-CoA carboxylase alpha subunit